MYRKTLYTVIHRYYPLRCIFQIIAVILQRPTVGIQSEFPGISKQIYPLAGFFYVFGRIYYHGIVRHPKHFDQILSVPDPYYLDKKVKLVELFSYHKLGLTNKYTHLFGDS